MALLGKEKDKIEKGGDPNKIKQIMRNVINTL